MNWIGRKIHLYNVTMGLYMLDWWERYLFSILHSFCHQDILVLILLWFICYNSTRFATDLYESHLKNKVQYGGNFGFGGKITT